MGRPGLSQHRKFRRLVRDLGCGDAAARGYLEFMWDVCYESGEEYLGDSDDVEAAARWEGKRGDLTLALASAGGDAPGFIELTNGKTDRYQVHDLWHHAPEYVRRRRTREVERRTKTTPCQSVTSQCPTNDGQCADIVVQNDRDDFPPSPSPVIRSVVGSIEPAQELMVSEPKRKTNEAAQIIQAFIDKVHEAFPGTVIKPVVKHFVAIDALVKAGLTVEEGGRLAAEFAKYPPRWMKDRNMTALDHLAKGMIELQEIERNEKR